MLCRKNISFGPAGLRKQSWTSIFERAFIWMCNGFSTRNLWATDIALLGQDITNTREYREADVIHLHWVNQGFISLASIQKMLDDGKKVVWTMHDAWNSMGAYHLKIQQKEDYLERSTRKRKQRLYAGSRIQFVTCSQWLRNEALKSPLMITPISTSKAAEDDNPEPSGTLPALKRKSCQSWGWILPAATGTKLPCLRAEPRNIPCSAFTHPEATRSSLLRPVPTPCRLPMTWPRPSSDG